VIVDAAIYKDGHRTPGTFELEGARQQVYAPDSFAWIGLYQPTPDEFEKVREEFNLHPLAVEDAIKAHQRPKLETYEDTLFVVLKPARYVDPVEVIEFGEILLFVASDFVVAVRHGEASALVEVRHQLENHPQELELGPGAVLHGVVDRVVDDYAAVLDGLEGDIGELEAQVFSNDQAPTERIYKLKREVLQFHQATQPLLGPLERLAQGGFAALSSKLQDPFRNTHDHLLRVVERISAYRELLTSILEANLIQVTVRQNDDMRRQNEIVKKVSSWAAIIAVPALITGYYGMNVPYPGSGNQTGVLVSTALIMILSGGLYLVFRHRDWL
jgi:magnesium transporter